MEKKDQYTFQKIAYNLYMPLLKLLFAHILCMHFLVLLKFLFLSFRPGHPNFFPVCKEEQVFERQKVRLISV